MKFGGLMKVSPGDEIHIWTNDGKTMMNIAGQEESVTLLSDGKDLGCDLRIQVVYPTQRGILDE